MNTEGKFTGVLDNDMEFNKKQGFHAKYSMELDTPKFVGVLQDMNEAKPEEIKVYIAFNDKEGLIYGFGMDSYGVYVIEGGKKNGKVELTKTYVDGT